MKNLLLYILFIFSSLFAQRGSSTGTIRGVVTDSRTKEPVIAAQVRIEKSDALVFTDPGGAFELNGVPTGKQQLFISATQYEDQELEVRVTAEENNRNLSITLSPIKSNSPEFCDTCVQPAVILGKVADARRNTPVVGASVRLLPSGITVETGEEGYFSITGILDGSYSLIFVHRDFYSDTVRNQTLVKGDIKQLEVPLEPLVTPEDETGIIKGRITDSATGSPIFDAVVSILNTEMGAHTDSSGAFKITLVDPGTYTVLVSKWKYETRITSGIIVRAKEETNFETTLRETPQQEMTSGGTIEGTVTDPGGEPFENAAVLLKETGDLVSSDFLGRFSFENIPSGVYTVVGVADGYDTSIIHDIDVWDGEIARIQISLEKVKKPLTALDSLTPEPGKGTIRGLVVSGEDGSAISGAAIQLTDTKLKSFSHTDGRYAFVNLDPGMYSIVARQSGYSEYRIDNVEVVPDGVMESDLVLSPSDINEMARMSVRARAAQNTGAALLKEREKAISFTDAIGAQEMSRTGASNAADAMKSVTGVTVVGGKYVIVRGLPERYTRIMLNGSPIPSPDPDRNAVNMDIFPAGIIENIVTYKTFTPNLPANFAGGLVDIKTKPFPEEFTLRVKASGAFNNQSTFNENYLTYKGGSLDWLGIDDGTRKRPSVLDTYTKEELDQYTSLIVKPVSGDYGVDRLSDPEDKIRDTMLVINQLAQQPTEEMTPQKTRAPLDQSYQLSIGNSWNIGNNPLGLFLGLNYSRKFSLYLNDIKYKLTFEKYNEQTQSYEDPVYDDILSINKAKETIFWGGLLTGAYKLGDNHEFNVDYMYTKNASDQVMTVDGRFGYYIAPEDINQKFWTSQLHFTSRTLNSLTLRSSHQLWLKHVPLTLRWRGAFINSQQEEPDLRNIYHIYEPTQRYEKINSSDTLRYSRVANAGNPSHQWRDLEKSSYSTDISLAIPFYQWTGDSATVTFGGQVMKQFNMVRRRKIDYRLDEYVAYLREENIADPNLYSSQDLIDKSNFGFQTDSSTKSGYSSGLFATDESEIEAQVEGEIIQNAAFIMTEIPIVSSLSTIIGLRYEYFKLAQTFLLEKAKESFNEGKAEEHNFFPSFALIFALNQKMKIRGAYNRTVSYPSMREKSEYTEESFTGGDSYGGSANLNQSLIDNFDLRYEWFMTPGELFAVSGFYKIIHRPIEIRYGNNDIRFPTNTKSNANLFGIEFEARKNLDFVSALKHFQFVGNLTLAYSKVELDSARLDSVEMAKNRNYFPKEPNERPFQDQTPIVLNMFLIYDNPDIGTNVNLLFNVFGTRMASLTDPDVPWLWEKPSPMLNLTASQKLLEKWTLSLKVQNILNSQKTLFYKYDDSEITVFEESPGRSYQLGIGYSF